MAGEAARERTTLKPSRKGGESGSIPPDNPGTGVVIDPSPVVLGLLTFFLGLAVGWLLSQRVRIDNARLRSELAHQQRIVPEKLALLDEAQAQLRTSFDAIAGAALRASTDEFLKLADQKLGN